jgi:hypothetical protein
MTFAGCMPMRGRSCPAFLFPPPRRRIPRPQRPALRCRTPASCASRRCCPSSPSPSPPVAARACAHVSGAGEAVRARDRLARRGHPPLDRAAGGCVMRHLERRRTHRAARGNASATRRHAGAGTLMLQRGGPRRRRGRERDRAWRVSVAKRLVTRWSQGRALDAGTPCTCSGRAGFMPSTSRKRLARSDHGAAPDQRPSVVPSSRE